MAGCERFELDMIDCLDGALDGERLAALEEHLRVCPACSHRLETMRVLMEETAALCVDVPDGLHDRILQRVARERKGGRLLRFASRRTIAAAAAVVLVCAASVYGVSRLYGQKARTQPRWNVSSWRRTMPHPPQGTARRAAMPTRVTLPWTARRIRMTKLRRKTARL